MDTGIIIGLVVSASVIAVLLFLVTKKSAPTKQEEAPQPAQPAAVVQNDREAQGNRGLERMRARQRKPVADTPAPTQAVYEPEPEIVQNIQPGPAQVVEAEEVASTDSEDDAGTDIVASSSVSKKKVSKKKLEREKRKEGIKEARQAEKAQYDAKKKREEDKDQEEQEKQEEELEKERLLEEDLRKIREEREKREEEEYMKMKSMMSVEEKGDAELAEEEKKRIEDAIVDAITKRKVVVMEDLAGELQIRTRELIDTIKELEESGKLSGVMDDRGKYIYITKEEQEKVAKFIIRKGRVSIEDIAFESNKLIKLEPVTV